MTPQEAKEFTDKWLPCREGGKSQAAKLIKFYHEEAEVFTPSHPQGLKGHQELCHFFELALETCSDWKFQMEELTATKDGFVFLYKVDIPFKNKVFEKFSGADIVKIKDGKIISHKSYYDQTPITHYKQQIISSFRYLAVSAGWGFSLFFAMGLIISLNRGDRLVSGGDFYSPGALIVSIILALFYGLPIGFISGIRTIKNKNYVVVCIDIVVIFALIVLGFLAAPVGFILPISYIIFRYIVQPIRKIFISKS